MANISPFPSQNQALNIRISNIKILAGDKATKGFADVRIGQVIVHGFCIVQNRQGGLFVAAPAKPSKDGKKNYPVCSIDEDFRKPLFDEILKAFNLARKEQQRQAAENAGR